MLRSARVEFCSVTRHIFYNTLYGSKSTQKDDTRGYIAVCNAISNRILNQEKEMEAEGEKLKESPPDFSEGLSRVLSALDSNVNANIISPTLSHCISTNGSRCFHMKQ